ncbi:flocculation protein FLO11-like [Megalobrama amblycephala]|uniref:flocculation protein FLO11-like n=1 Tax=Megalobrama amblycephala TaxID=75352 RepID=UPI002013E3A8|nr:flocculation protein FLO11-like [Megalobrama amblycephala]
MASNYREVCMEIYFNGEFYCGDSCWVPDGEEVELEFQLTDAIYDLIGTDPSAQIHLELQAETDDDDISVSYCALEGNVVKLVADKIKTTSVCECGAKEKLCEGPTDPEGPSAEVAESSSGVDASLEAPQIRPTESTNGWINTIGTFFKRLFWRDPAVPESVCVTDASTPEPTSELDLVDTEQSSVPFPSIPEPEPEPEESTVPGPSSSEPEPELDLVDPESGVPGPSSSETLCQEVDIDDAISDLKSPTLVSEDLKMDASPETPEENSPKKRTKVKKKMHKICAFFKRLFGKDRTVPEPLCVPDASTPVPEPELDLDAIEPSSVPVPSVPELEPDLDLFDSDESSCDLVPTILELEADLDRFDSDESCVPGPSSAVPRPKASTSKQHPCFQLEERVKACRMHYKPVTQVWNNIFIGNEETAKDRMRMKELGITHILNAAAMKKNLRILLGMPWEQDVKDTVDTGARYYRGMKIRYCGLPTTKTSNISKYFLPAAKFIHKAKENSENKVFIHCTDGVSYAPTLFLAYLIIHQNMTVEDAIDYLVKVKYIKPDIDFLRQLAILQCGTCAQAQM